MPNGGADDDTTVMMREPLSKSSPLFHVIVNLFLVVFVCPATISQVAECDVYRLEDKSEPGGFRFLLVEPFLEGKYLKVRSTTDKTQK